MSTAHGGAGGAIVNVSSRAAQLGAPGEYVDYAASKAALDALTIGLAREVAGEGIRVNGVRAGIIYTDIHADGGEPGRVDRLGPTLPMQRGGARDRSRARDSLAAVRRSVVLDRHVHRRRRRKITTIAGRRSTQNPLNTQKLFFKDSEPRR